MNNTDKKKHTVSIDVPEGYKLIDKGNGHYEVVKKEQTLPKTWGEFCDKYPIKYGECYIDADSTLVDGVANTKRGFISGRNLLPNEKIAKAVRALCMLIQLRDCYNGYWEPDWKNEYEKKYVIVICRGEAESFRFETSNKVLAFKTEDLRDQFLENFRDLIEIAKPLI